MTHGEALACIRLAVRVLAWESAVNERCDPDTVQVIRERVEQIVEDRTREPVRLIVDAGVIVAEQDAG